MAAQKFNLILFMLLCTSCSTSVQSQPLVINNNLSKCISFSDLKVSLDEVVPVAKGKVSVDKPISECGCKSVLGLYNVYQKNETYRSYVLGGKISLLKSGSKIFPLSAEAKLIKDKIIEIDISCAQPD